MKLNGIYAVERMLLKLKKLGSIEYFVKFKGYPGKFNVLIPTEHIKYEPTKDERQCVMM